MATRTVLVTPRGRAIYPKLHTPDIKFSLEGTYSVKLAVSKTAAEDLIQKLDQMHAQAVAEAKKANPKKNIKEALCYSDNPENEDEVIFNIKMKASGTTKKGEAFTQHPALFDAKGKPLAKDVRVGGGSTVRVSFEPAPFYVAAVGAGLTLRLKAVQVIELKSYGGGDSKSFGFDEEEGYVGEEAPANEFSEEKAEESVKATGSDF